MRVGSLTALNHPAYSFDRAALSFAPTSVLQHTATLRDELFFLAIPFALATIFYPSTNFNEVIASVG